MPLDNLFFLLQGWDVQPIDGIFKVHRIVIMVNDDLVNVGSNKYSVVSVGPQDRESIRTVE